MSYSNFYIVYYFLRFNFFCQKYKTSNRKHNIPSETFNFTLVELKLKN